MSDPVGAREALIIEAIGETANLIDAMGQLTLQFQEMAREVAQANAGLRDALAGFEAQILALAEKAKVQTVKHLLARTDEAARRSIEQQRRAMADAAQAAFDAALGATVQRLQPALQALTERPVHPWTSWLTHLATAATASMTAWALARYLPIG